MILASFLAWGIAGLVVWIAGMLVALALCLAAGKEVPK